MKFKVGDLVRLKSKPTYTGKIFEIFVGMGWSDYFGVLFDDGARLYLEEDDIELLYSASLILFECDCGAKHVKGYENFHADWCSANTLKLKK